MLKGPEIIPDGDVTAAVVFLHGYGADGNDLIGLARPLQKHFPQMAFFSPNAPQKTAMGIGRQWFSDAGGTFVDRPGIDAATQNIEQYLEERLYTPHGLTPKQVVLVGFSMGTMTALYAAPRLAGGVAGVVGFSGMMLFAEGLKNLERKNTMPIALIHGTDDTVVPYMASQQAEANLKAEGFDVTLDLISGLGHGIDEQGLEILRDFLENNLSPLE